MKLGLGTFYFWRCSLFLRLPEFDTGHTFVNLSMLQAVWLDSIIKRFVKLINNDVFNRRTIIRYKILYIAFSIRDWEHEITCLLHHFIYLCRGTLFHRCWSNLHLYFLIDTYFLYDQFCIYFLIHMSYYTECNIEINDSERLFIIVISNCMQFWWTCKLERVASELFCICLCVRHQVYWVR